MATKKVGSSGRLGSRYGRKTRKTIATIEQSSRAKHKCPSCLKTSLKRLSAGVWYCGSCSIKLAGGAYSPITSANKVIKQSIQRVKRKQEAVEVEAE